MSNKLCGFFAYPSIPSRIPELIGKAVNQINKNSECQVKTWEDCSISGKIIIDVICREIESADLFLADLTGANPNVLFELGYAIGKRKRVWVLLDTSIEDSKSLFDQLSILTTVGYAPYSNSENIVHEFFKHSPWRDLNDTIFKMSIEPTLDLHEDSSLLYLKHHIETEASRELSRVIEKFRIPVMLSDPYEGSVQTLGWYANKIFHSIGVIAHLSDRSRTGYLLHNSRYAFVSGLAHGFDKPLLMLAESDYQTPIDYKDILHLYKTASDCKKFSQDWLEPVSAKYENAKKEYGQFAKKFALEASLKSINLGEYIAENEEQTLEQYFIETQAFSRVINGQNSIIVGRKGSGKTATLYMAANRLREDKRNLVCVIKPVSYDVQGVVRLSKQILEKDNKGYLSETLWKFLVYSEIAWFAYAEISQRPCMDGNSPENELKKFMEGQGKFLKDEFPVRLDRCVRDLSAYSPNGDIGDFRYAVSEQLHGGILSELRRLLGNLLTKRHIVAVLIDNLDKAWDRREDLEHLTGFLFGLIRVAKDITRDFSNHDNKRKPVNMSITIFLRSDIFARVIKDAREPDKMQHFKLDWEDPEILIRVLYERLSANRKDVELDKLWQGIFCPKVKGISSSEYIIKTVLPRPRDLIFFAQAALSTAVNRGHDRVEESDIIEAEKQYSQFALESVKVENGITLPELEAIMYEFVGMPCILTEDKVFSFIVKSGIEEKRKLHALNHLIALSFFGVEVDRNEFRYCTNTDEFQKLSKLKERYILNNNMEPRYKIHNAFHAFLETSNEDD